MSINLLVPLDSSPWSTAAARLALQLASAQPSRLTVVHVVNVRSASGNILADLPGHLGFEPAVVSDAIVAEHTAKAKLLVDEFAAKARAQGCHVDTKVVTGSVAHTLKDLAESADLVVMGLRGETEGRFEGQGGALSAWLPERLDTPILWAVPGASPIRSVAVGYDGSPACRHALRAIRHFLEPLGVPVHGIFVSRDGTGGEVLGQLESELPGCEVNRHVVEGTDAHHTLIETAERLDAQVLVLGFRGLSRLRDFAFATASERILLSGQLAVLIAH